MTPLTVIPEHVKKAADIATNLYVHDGGMTDNEEFIVLAALNADRAAESERVKALVEAAECVLSDAERDGDVNMVNALRLRAALSAYEKENKS